MRETGAERYRRFGQEVPDQPEIPRGFEIHLEWFNHLSRRRVETNHIPYLEIQSFCSMTRTSMTHHDVQIIVMMDDAWVTQTRIEQRKAHERKQAEMTKGKKK